MSAFLEMANQEKTDFHTNILNWWLQLKYTSNGEKMIFVCVWIFWWEGREGSKEVGTWVGRDVGSQELREHTLMSPISQRVEISTGSVVCTEGE